jgi:hypothetical protein
MIDVLNLVALLIGAFSSVIALTTVMWLLQTDHLAFQ